MFIVLCCVFAEIIDSPEPVNIGENGVAVFNCTAVSTRIIFSVNGQPFDPDMQGIRMLDTKVLNKSREIRSRSLVVDATLDRNGTEVVCLAFYSKKVNTSDPVMMLVQGISLATCTCICMCTCVILL